MHLSRVGWYALQVAVFCAWMWMWFAQAPRAITGLWGPNWAGVLAFDLLFAVFGVLFAAAATAVLVGLVDWYRFRFAPWLRGHGRAEAAKWSSIAEDRRRSR